MNPWVVGGCVVGIWLLGITLGWWLRGVPRVDRDRLPRPVLAEDLLPATARQIKSAQRSQRLDLRRALRR